ncbi:hypothetical protein [Candidatus Phytoplasma oryzae]|nr:hypothetical protein PIE28_01975 [Candidatus Phytoplasma oryzae]
MNLEMNNIEIIWMILLFIGFIVIISIPLYVIYYLIQLLVNFSRYLKSKHQLNQLTISKQKQKLARRKKIKDKASPSDQN